MGTGKTTLARGLAHRLGWTYVPETAPALAYLEDLFREPRRWAFETQASFLVHKATQTLALMRRDRDVLMDRTLAEDIEVFARGFADRGDFDERAYVTYDALARYFLDEIGPPDVVILCECPFDIAQERRGERGRAIDKLYPPGHVEGIWKSTADWAAEYSDSPLLAIDTSVHDIRPGHPGLTNVINDLTLFLDQQSQPDNQMSLFSAPSRQAGALSALTIRTPAVPLPFQRSRSPLREVGISTEGVLPNAYIAAPFSGITTAREKAPGAALFELTQPHGVIPKGPYRTMLNDVARKLRAMGFAPILPHRDVNKWGMRTLEPPDVVRMCTEHVRRSSFFVGLLGESHGSHYEFGIALGMGRPAVIIACAELRSSFIASGVGSSSLANVLRMDCKTIGDIPALLDTDAFRAFVGRYFP